MKKFTYSVYIITKDGNRIWWTSGQSYLRTNQVRDHVERSKSDGVGL